MGLMELAAAVVSGGGLGVAGAYFTARAKARTARAKARGDAHLADATVDRSRIIHDERIAPQLLDRIKDVEGRYDESIRIALEAKSEAAAAQRDATQAQELVRECERHRGECEEKLGLVAQELADLSTRVESRDADVTQRVELAVRRSMSGLKAQPPAGEDEERR